MPHNHRHEDGEQIGERRERPKVVLDPDFSKDLTDRHWVQRQMLGSGSMRLGTEFLSSESIQCTMSEAGKGSFVEFVGL